MKKKLRKHVVDYLKEAKLMQIATSKNNKPWVATVWYVHDDELNLYFISRRSTRHSLEIRDNTNVAGAIVKPHVKGSGEKVIGLQFEGTSHDITDEPDVLKKVHELYLAKHSLAEDIPLKQLSDPEWIAAYYVIHPKTFVLFNDADFPNNPRKELKL